MGTPLPPISDMTGASVAQGGFKAKLAEWRAYLVGLLSDTGETADARKALGVPGNEVISKSSDYTVLAADAGKTFVWTGSTDRTASFVASATLGNGWTAEFINTMSAVLTLDPNLSEAIEGDTTYPVQPGGRVMLRCDGTQLLVISSASRPAGELVLATGNTAPDDTVKLNGALYLRVDYPRLWAYAQASGNIAASDGAWTSGQYSPGDGATTFRVPDVRGEFFRAWDDGSGVDAGRTIGSWQADLFKSHTHTYSKSGSTSATGSTSTVGSAAQTSTATSSTGGSETRPRNVAYLACVTY